MSGTLKTHLQTGQTSVCRCWKITRADGTSLGFTDHDENVEFDSVVFQAGTGLSPAALTTATGLSVDNSEAVGALNSNDLSEDLIAAGAFDGAEITAYLVNWSNPNEREVQFRGHLGEIVRSGGQFRAEVRGLSDALNQSRGRVFQKPCSAVLGDSACTFDVTTAGYSTTAKVVEIVSDSQLRVNVAGAHADRWFERGLATFDVTEKSLSIKRDQVDGDSRELTFWQAITTTVQIGDVLTLTAGCDRRAETCRNKFSNINNFRGFPDIPGEDWVYRTPTSGQIYDGGSRR